MRGSRVEGGPAPLCMIWTGVLRQTVVQSLGGMSPVTVWIFVVSRPSPKVMSVAATNP